MDTLETLISQMTDDEVDAGIEQAKNELLTVRTKAVAEVIFAGGVLLVVEQRRRRDRLTEELRRVLTAGNL